MTAILKVSDGTTTVDLLDRKSGFHLRRWRHSIPKFKNAGTWKDSPLAPGRSLADYQLANSIQTIEIDLRGGEQDALIRQAQDLQRLLLEAANYSVVNWQSCPVWLEAKASCETNTRYARIEKGEIPELDNTYGHNFLGRLKSLNELSLIVEIGPWTETAPGTGVAIEVSNPGRAATSAVEQVFVANKHNTAALTHIYTATAGGVWSANLVASTAFGILPANVNNGDAVYFGIAAAHEDPFCSLVFDIGVAMVGITSTAWTTHGGVVGANTWNALDVQDNTNADGAGTGWAFDTLGVKSVHWQQPSTWTIGNLLTIFGGTAPNVTATWVRVLVTSGGAGTTPTQQNRAVYTVLWPYVQIAAAQVPGDIPPALKARTWNESGIDGVDGGGGVITISDVPLYFHRQIAGLRSVARGADFTPYINLSDEQNDVDIAVDLTVATPGTLVFAVDALAPSGRSVTFAPAGTNEALWIAISGDLVPQYIGSYHAFLRMRVPNAAGPVTLYMITLFGGITQQYPLKTTAEENDWVLFDYGRIDLLPASIKTTEVPTSLKICLALEAAATIYLYDLVLIPVDEWASDTFTDATLYGGAGAEVARHHDLPDASGAVVSNAGLLDLDAIGYPKEPERAVTRRRDDVMWGSPAQRTNGAPMLQPNAQQRLWFLWHNQQLGLTTYKAQCEITNTVNLQRQAKYLSFRGAR